MKKGKKKSKEQSLLLKLMIICVALSVVMLGIVVYEKLIKTPENTCVSCLNK